MRIIIDTSVVVSAVLRNRVPELVILFLVSHPEFEWVVSRAILDEYREVLARPKFELPVDILGRWYEMFDKFTTLVDVDLNFDFSRDQGDAKFLSCAVAASAQFLITGDHDFDEARKLLDTTIVSATVFKRAVIDVWQ